MSDAQEKPMRKEPPEDGQPVVAPPSEDTAVPSDQEAVPVPRKRKLGIALDAVLVLLVIGVLGGVSWYVKQELPKSPYEMARAENARLRGQREKLLPAAYQAEERVYLRKRLEELELEIEAQQRSNISTAAGIQEKQRKILAKQHEIRQTDKEYRQVAMSLLPGMQLGTVRTRKGSRVYYQARVTRVSGRTLMLSHAEGMVRLQAADLVAETLPALARYAFGVDDLLHISEMNAEISAQSENEQPSPQSANSAVKKKKGRAQAAGGDNGVAEQSYAFLSPSDYEPPMARPVVDVKLPARVETAPSASSEDTSLIATPMNEVMPVWLKQRH
ncbi:MAG: hypothetical protein LUG84_00690 [Akkermansiaceae bacterium]|nr:hypothetical protein [Akkermansiaceae bacterium]